MTTNDFVAGACDETRSSESSAVSGVARRERAIRRMFRRANEIRAMKLTTGGREGGEGR